MFYVPPVLLVGNVRVRDVRVYAYVRVRVCARARACGQ